MLDSEKSNERLLLLQQLRDLNAERIEHEMAEQHQAWKLALEENNRATIERLAVSKMPHGF
jgi:hypothetical protein